MPYQKTNRKKGSRRSSRRSTPDPLKEEEETEAPAPDQPMQEVEEKGEEGEDGEEKATEGSSSVSYSDNPLRVSFLEPLMSSHTLGSSNLPLSAGGVNPEALPTGRHSSSAPPSAAGSFALTGTSSQHATLARVSEFKEILDDPSSPHNYRPSSIFLNKYPDIGELEIEVLQKIGSDSKTVVSQVKRLTFLLASAKDNERALQNRLNETEHKMEQMVLEAKTDPRLWRVIELANHWRQEKKEKEEDNMELCYNIDQFRTDIREMETTIDTLDHKFKTAVGRLMQEKKIAEHYEERASDLELSLKKAEMLIKKLEADAADRTEKIRHLKKALDKDEKRRAHCEALERKMYVVEKEWNVLVATRDDLDNQVKKYRISDSVNSYSIVNLNKEVKALKGSVQTFKRNVLVLEETILKQNRAIEERTKKSNHFMVREQEAEHEINILNHRLKDKEDEIKRNNDEIKQRNTLLFYKQKEIDHLKAKFEQCSSELKSEVQIQTTLGNSLTKVEKQNHKNIQKIELLNIKANDASQQVRDEQKKVKSAADEVRCMQRTVDELNPLLKTYASCNNQLFEDNMLKARRIMELQKVSKEQKKAIQLSENTSLGLLNTLKSYEYTLGKTHETLMMCKRSNCILASEAFDFLEHVRDLQNCLKVRAREIKSSARSIEDTDRVMQALLLKEIKQTEEINKRITEINAMNDEARKATIVLELKSAELNNVYHSLHDLQETLRRAAVREKDLTHQRDVFAARVVQAKVELQLQEMKMMKMEDVIKTGSTQYKQIVSDKVLLIKEISNLRRTVKSLQGCTKNNQVLKEEVIRTRRALTMETIKNKAVSEMRPTILHPKRELKAMNPSEYEQVLKIQLLTKRLITKTDIVVEQEQKILALEKNLFEMKVTWERHSARGLAFTMMKSKAEASVRTKQLKAVMAELNMVNYELEREKDSAKESQKKYKETLEKANKANAILRSKPTPPQMYKIKPSRVYRRPLRYVGGGYQLQGKTRSDQQTSSPPENNISITEKSSPSETNTSVPVTKSKMSEK